MLTYCHGTTTRTTSSKPTLFTIQTLARPYNSPSYSAITTLEHADFLGGVYCLSDPFRSQRICTKSASSFSLHHASLAPAIISSGPSSSVPLSTHPPPPCLVSPSHAPSPPRIQSDFFNVSQAASGRVSVIYAGLTDCRRAGHTLAHSTVGHANR